VTQQELESLWVKPEGISGVLYRFGRDVRVRSGTDAGKVGRVVALLAVEPTPQYVIELPKGDSLVVLQGNLEQLA
jgi:hypothetical protein